MQSRAWHRWVFFGVLVLMPGIPVQAQTVTAEEAQARFQKQDWVGAAEAYEALTTDQPESGIAWYRLGVAKHQLKAYEGAAIAWKKAETLSFAPQRTRYNLAATYAQQGDNETAFGWLEKAVAAGFGQLQQLKTDPDLMGLHEDPRFEKIVEGVDKNANPCEYDKRHRQFDFWIGTWNVSNAQGQRLGTNTIEKMLGGCALQENWIGAGGGGGGKSFNYYDAAAEKWKQIWVDAQGSSSLFIGSFIDGAMRFEGEWVNLNGTTSLMKMTFTPLEDGRVRQFFEQSTDGGATWNVWFDGYYARSDS